MKTALAVLAGAGLVGGLVLMGLAYEGNRKRCGGRGGGCGDGGGGGCCEKAARPGSGKACEGRGLAAPVQPGKEAEDEPGCGGGCSVGPDRLTVTVDATGDERLGTGCGCGGGGGSPVDCRCPCGAEGPCGCARRPAGAGEGGGADSGCRCVIEGDCPCEDRDSARCGSTGCGAEARGGSPGCNE